MHLKSCRKLPCGRSVPLKETIQRLELLMATSHDYTLYEEQVSEHLFWAALFVDELDFRAMGKGISAEHARAGALAEAAEWLFTRSVTELPGYTVSHQDDLSSGTFIPLESLLEHVATATPPVVESIKDIESAQIWVDGWSMIQQSPVKVPLDYVGVICGPNGKAAGNTLEEAIEHAILEIFERRAHITVMRNRLVLPTIDPASIKYPLLQELMSFVRSKGIEFTIKDLSFEGCLPCVGTYFKDPFIPDDYQFHHFFKVGSGFNKLEALVRTFTEFVQGRMKHEFSDGSLSDLNKILSPDFRGLKTLPGAGDNFLSAFMFGFMPSRDATYLEQGERVTFDQGPCFQDSRDDVEASIEVCRDLGKDMIVVDLTAPLYGFPVVQVVVPGYSDVLPYHPPNSHGLFRRLARSEVLTMYAK